MLFTQNSENNAFLGLQRMILDSVSASDIDIRKDLLMNIIISGGTSLLNGFIDRLQKMLN